MGIKDLRSLLGRIGAIRHPCDLDLLLFFYRHPRALLTAESVVAYLGYERVQVAKSLETLIETRLVTRSQNPTRAARLYVLELEAIPGGVLRTLLGLAATRQGRQEAMQALASPADRAPRAAIRRTASNDGHG